jgi:outer membrane biosynthesis protein TonB
VLEEKQDAVYQMQLAATSLFGEGDDGKYPMQGYARLLNEHNMPVSAVVTAVSFDDEAETPKLYFRPDRPLDEDELENVLALQDSPEVAAAISMTVSQTDKSGDDEEDEEEAPKPKAKAKPKAKVKPKPPAEEKDDEDDEEEVEPPKRRSTKKAEPKVPEATEDDDHSDELGSIVDGWDDEDDDDED